MKKKQTVLHLLDCTFSVEWWKLLKEKCNLTAQDWFNKGTFFQTALAEHLEKCCSDNCPVLVVFPELNSHLKHFSFIRKRKSSLIGDHSKCAICKDTCEVYDDTVVADCGHAFHFLCFLMLGAGSCNVCRKRVNVKFRPD